MPSVKISKSTSSGKKMMAVFSFDDGKKKTIHFGQAGASDYTKNKDEKRKKAYLDRHKANENWNDYDTAGALSRWVLWNKPTLTASISDYKKRFGLK